MKELSPAALDALRPGFEHDLRQARAEERRLATEALDPLKADGEEFLREFDAELARRGFHLTATRPRKP